MTLPSLPFFMSAYFVFTLLKGIYFLINIALIVRLWRMLSLPDAPASARAARFALCVLTTALSLCLPLARSLDGHALWIKALTFLGNAWLAFVLYILVGWLILRVFFWLNHRFRWRDFSSNPTRWKLIGCAALACFSLLTCSIAWLNTQFVTTRAVQIAIPELSAPLTVVALSDLHLGRLASPAFLSRVIDEIEPHTPDLIMLAGDLLEYDFDAEDIPGARAAFARLTPRLGIWGVPGNHEYINGRGELSKDFLAQIGVRALYDQWVTLTCGQDRLLLIGRDDRSVRTRKTLPELLADAPQDGALKLLLDHQPYHLDAAEAADVRLQISGHTHNGQLFPFNIIVALLYENAYGYSRRGKTHYWVTSGAGTWGPRMRNTGLPEIVRINLVPARAL
jgi:predicted MPP superfamily phosphohydrolase